MAETSSSTPEGLTPDLEKTLEDIEYTGRKHSTSTTKILGIIAASWSLFQLWIASPIPFEVSWLKFAIISDSPARSTHLAFALLLVFLVFPMSRRRASSTIPWTDVALALLACFCALYPALNWANIATRAGILLELDVFGFTIPFEAILGWVGIICLLEATRRGIGLPLVCVASVFILYSIFGQQMPDLISHKGVSLSRLSGYQWLSNEAIFGIPIEVTTSFVFLFVLFGAILDKAGAGRFFLNLAFSMVGQFSGGPAKAAILASGMTGLISGSSIANVVTTGTFTIPVMKRIGMPAVKAGAIEVAASVNGQIMPPIMGAAAFIIAEFVGVTYNDVIIAAFIPAFICYIALLYISHMEAQKLGLRGLPKEEVPAFMPTLMSGLHFLIPVGLLVYLLLIERWTPASAVFYSINLMFLIIIAQKLWSAHKTGASMGQAFMAGLTDIYGGLIVGARNMITIAIAVGAAGIIVGSVSSTGLNNALISVVEAISGGNIYILLFMTSILCLILGMGLPTTANYVVVASLLAGVVVELGNAAGLVLPLIAVHLYVFYFGLMADVTPPVCLAAFAASAISRADPLKTGFQAFFYEIRTAMLPVVFIFNTELLLIGVESFWHGLMVFVVSLIAILCFSSLTQRWMFTRVKLWEMAVLFIVMVGLFRPNIYMSQIYPDFIELDPAKFVAGEIQIEPGRDIRVHVTRSTEYGDRFKLFRIPIPEDADGDIQKVLGLTLERDVAGNYFVSDVSFEGKAEKIGITWDDLITGIEVEQLDRPAKAWVYPFMLILLGVVIFAQLKRRREEAPSAVPA